MALAILLLILLPAAEIAVFILVGDAIGVWRTIALVFLSALLGLLLLRVQGLVTLARVRTAVERGDLPTRELFDGACFVAAGLLLLVPGFLTDLLGALLLLPPMRAVLRRALGGRVGGRSRGQVWTGGGGTATGEAGRSGRRPQGPGPVIDGHYEELPGPDSQDGDRPSPEDRRPANERNGDPRP